MLAFTNDCIHSLGNIDYININRNFDRNIDTSFFMISLLKIDEEIVVKAFESKSFNERLQIVKEFVDGKRPSRVYLKVRKENYVSGRLGMIIIAACLVVLLFIDRSK